MTENSPEHSDRVSIKRSFEIGVSSGIIALANTIPNETIRFLVSIAAPPMGYGMGFLIKLCRKEIRYFRLKRGIKAMIKELEEEYNSPTTTGPRKKQVQKEIESYRQLLKKHRLDNLDINIP